MQKQYELSLEGKGLFAEPQGKIVRKDLTYIDENGVENSSWPKRYSMEWVKKTKQKYVDTNDISTFYQEFYNMPKEESNPIFNTECIRETKGVFKKSKYVKYIELENGTKIAVNTFIGFDPAIRFKAHNDYNCLCAIGIDSNENYYILDIEPMRIKETEKPLKIIEWAEKYQIDSGTIETYGYQFSLFEWTMKAMRDLNKYYLFNEFGGTQGAGMSKKQKYVEGLVNPVNNSKVSYLSSAIHAIDMKQQMVKFSGGKRTHDDLIDGLFLAMYRSWKSSITNDYVDILLKREAEENKSKAKDTEFNPLNWGSM
jgi:hypothetical protein